MEFPGRKRIPETLSESERELVRENREQDAQIGLLEWEMEEREKQHDIEHLTRLRTREFFDNELKLICGEIVEKRRGVEPLKKVSLILIDLDHFKKVNDSLGHAAGDEVLRRVSAFLIDSVRPTDTVARFGGEELIILMRDASVEVAARHAEEIRAKIAELKFNAYSELKITASFGVCSAEVSPAINSKTLVEQADKALYEAKVDEKEGRNRVRVYGGA